MNKITTHNVDINDVLAPSSGSGHLPVMLREVIAALQPIEGAVIVDGTFGAGGYTRALLQLGAKHIYAIDRDPAAQMRAEKMATEFPGRMTVLRGRFGAMEQLLAAANVIAVDGIVLDLGLSSLQLSEAERGFSFQNDGPLDMRMGRDGESAADIVNTYAEEDIADILYTLGEERAARRIARKIVERRAEEPITTTRRLAKIIHEVLPMHGGMKTDTATRSFQALRIHVNDELGELDAALECSTRLLREDGRMVVVSFHSLEDARVKNFFRDRCGRAPAVSRHVPAAPVAAPALFTLPRGSDMKPAADEIMANPRARSARLRYALRTAQPAQGGRDA